MKRGRTRKSGMEIQVKHWIQKEMSLKLFCQGKQGRIDVELSPTFIRMEKAFLNISWAGEDSLTNKPPQQSL